VRLRKDNEKRATGRQQRTGFGEQVLFEHLFRVQTVALPGTRAACSRPRKQKGSRRC
jgi:hypothetical protein